MTTTSSDTPPASVDLAFNPAPILAYLGLPPSYTPSPEGQAVEFLKKHIRELPPHLLAHFSPITTPKQRTLIPAIRNRRTKYVESRPSEFTLEHAKATWPALWEGRERAGEEQARDEEEWATNEFLGGLQKHVGKLGRLLGGYEEERESERTRIARRQRAEYLDSLPEEDDETDEEEEVEAEPDPDPAEAQERFLRLVRERFIYGLLETEYDHVDWDDLWDAGEGDRDAEDKWFDDEEED